jgi:hypothetical protein
VADVQGCLQVAVDCGLVVLLPPMRTAAGVGHVSRAAVLYRRAQWCAMMMWLTCGGCMLTQNTRLLGQKQWLSCEHSSPRQSHG